MTRSSNQQAILETKNLTKHFERQSNILDRIFGSGKEPVVAVDKVSLEVQKNQAIGIIGESGCGKTTLLRLLMGLYDPTDGQILYKGQDIGEFGKRQLKEYRQNVQIIFQDPFNSLDPKFTVEQSLIEPLQIHGIKGDRRARARQALEDADLRPAEEYLDRRPDELSGGEKQRVSIARALVVDPEIILADEPVSMLDVSTQAEILKLISNLVEEKGLTLIYISHDLSTVSYVCDMTSVMYLGRMVEYAPTLDLINDPKHPYSQALIDAIPIPDPHIEFERVELKGSPGDPIGLGEGCRFRDRCPDRMDICEQTPIDYSPSEDRMVACHLYYDHESATGRTGDEQEQGVIR